MTDYSNIVNDLLGINDTLFAIGTSNINIDKISIRMAFDKNWHNIAERAATAIKELQAQLPKRGEIVRCRECRWGVMCVIGLHLGLDGFCSKGEREVQDEGAGSV